MAGSMSALRPEAREFTPSSNTNSVAAANVTASSGIMSAANVAHHMSSAVSGPSGQTPSSEAPGGRPGGASRQKTMVGRSMTVSGSSGHPTSASRMQHHHHQHHQHSSGGPTGSGVGSTGRSVNRGHDKTVPNGPGSSGNNRRGRAATSAAGNVPSGMFNVSTAPSSGDAKGVSSASQSFFSGQGARGGMPASSSIPHAGAMSGRKQKLDAPPADSSCNAPPSVSSSSSTWLNPDAPVFVPTSVTVAAIAAAAVTVPAATGVAGGPVAQIRESFSGHRQVAHQEGAPGVMPSTANDGSGNGRRGSCTGGSFSPVMAAPEAASTVDAAPMRPQRGHHFTTDEEAYAASDSMMRAISTAMDMGLTGVPPMHTRVYQEPIHAEGVHVTYCPRVIVDPCTLRTVSPGAPARRRSSGRLATAPNVPTSCSGVSVASSGHSQQTFHGGPLAPHPHPTSAVSGARPLPNGNFCYYPVAAAPPEGLGSVPTGTGSSRPAPSTAAPLNGAAVVMNVSGSVDSASIPAGSGMAANGTSPQLSSPLVGEDNRSREGAVTAAAVTAVTNNSIARNGHPRQIRATIASAPAPALLPMGGFGFPHIPFIPIVAPPPMEDMARLNRAPPVFNNRSASNTSTSGRPGGPAPSSQSNRESGMGNSEGASGAAQPRVTMNEDLGSTPSRGGHPLPGPAPAAALAVQEGKVTVPVERSTIDVVHRSGGVPLSKGPQPGVSSVEESCPNETRSGYHKQQQHFPAHQRSPPTGGPSSSGIAGGVVTTEDQLTAANEATQPPRRRQMTSRQSKGGQRNMGGNSSTSTVRDTRGANVAATGSTKHHQYGAGSSYSPSAPAEVSSRPEATEPANGLSLTDNDAEKGTENDLHLSAGPVVPSVEGTRFQSNQCSTCDPKKNSGASTTAYTAVHQTSPTISGVSGKSPNNEASSAFHSENTKQVVNTNNVTPGGSSSSSTSGVISSRSSGPSWAERVKQGSLNTSIGSATVVNGTTAVMSTAISGGGSNTGTRAVALGAGPTASSSQQTMNGKNNGGRSHQQSQQQHSGRSTGGASVGIMSGSTAATGAGNAANKGAYLGSQRLPAHSGRSGQNHQISLGGSASNGMPSVALPVGSLSPAEMAGFSGGKSFSNVPGQRTRGGNGAVGPAVRESSHGNVGPQQQQSRRRGGGNSSHNNAASASASVRLSNNATGGVSATGEVGSLVNTASSSRSHQSSSFKHDKTVATAAMATATPTVQQGSKQLEAGKSTGQHDKEGARKKISSESKVTGNNPSIMTSGSASLTADPTNLTTGVKEAPLVEDKAKMVMGLSTVGIKKQPSPGIEEEVGSGECSVRARAEQPLQQPTVMNEDSTAVFSSNSAGGGGISWASIAATSKRAASSSRSSTSGVPAAPTCASATAVSSTAVTVVSHGGTGVRSTAVEEVVATPSEIKVNATDHSRSAIVGDIKQKEVNKRNEEGSTAVVGAGGASSQLPLKKLGASCVDGGAGVAAHLATPLIRPVTLGGVGASANVLAPGSAGSAVTALPPILSDSPSARRKIGNAPLTSGMPSVIPPHSLATPLEKIENPLVLHKDRGAGEMEEGKATNDTVEEERRLQEACSPSASLPVVLPPLALSSPAHTAAQQFIICQSESGLPVRSGCSVQEPTTVVVSSASPSSSPNLKQETLSGSTAATFAGPKVEDLKKLLDPSDVEVPEVKTQTNTDASPLTSVSEMKKMVKTSGAISVHETSFTKRSTTATTTTTAKDIMLPPLEELKEPTTQKAVSSAAFIVPPSSSTTVTSASTRPTGVSTSIGSSSVTAAAPRVRSGARNKIKNVPAPMPVVLAQAQEQPVVSRVATMLESTPAIPTPAKDRLDKQAPMPEKNEKIFSVQATPSAPADMDDKPEKVEHGKTAATVSCVSERGGSTSENTGPSSSSAEPVIHEQHGRSMDTPSSGAESSTTANLLTTTTGTTDTTSPRQPDGTAMPQGQEESINTAGAVPDAPLEVTASGTAIVSSTVDREISAAQEAMTYSLPLMLRIRNYHQKHADVSSEALTGPPSRQARQHGRYIPLPGAFTGELAELSPKNDIESVTGRVLTSTPSCASPTATSGSQRARTTDILQPLTRTEDVSQSLQATVVATEQRQDTSDMVLDEKTCPQIGRYSLAFLLGVKPENLSHLRGVGNTSASGLSSAFGGGGIVMASGTPSSGNAISGGSAGGYPGSFLASDSGANIGIRSASGNSGGGGSGANSIATAHQIWRTAVQRAATGGGSPLRSGSLRRVPVKGGGSAGNSGAGGLPGSNLGGGNLIPRSSGGGGRSDHRRGDDSGRAAGTNAAGGADEDGWRAAPPARALPENNTRLQRAANVKEHGELIHRKLRSILNKLTVEKFNTLYEQIKNAGMVDAEDVKRLMELICSKAKTQHHFIPMYVKLCVLLNKDLPSMNIIGEGDAQFRRLLVDACQASFEETMKPIVIPEGLNEDDAFEFTLAEKKKMKGNMIFVAELSKTKMIATKVIGNCISCLIENHGEPQLEALSELLMTAGPHVCSGKLRATFEKQMQQVIAMAKDDRLSVRIRCLLQDVVDDYACGWKKALKNREGPTTLDALHQQVVDESRSKAAATAGSFRGGGSGGSGGGDYNFGPSMNFLGGGSNKHSSRGGGDDDVMGGRGSCRGMRSNRFSGGRDLNRMGGGGRDRDTGDYGLGANFGSRRAMTSAISSSGAGGGSGLSGLDRNGMGGNLLRASGGVGGASHRAAGLALSGSGAGTREPNATGSNGFTSGPPAKEGRPVMSFFGSSSGTTIVDAPLSSPLLSHTPLPSTQTRTGVSSDAARYSRASRPTEAATPLSKQKPLDREDAQNRVMIVFDSLCSDSSADDVQQAVNSFKEYLAQHGGTEEDFIYLVSHMVYLISDARIAKQPVLSQWLCKCITEKVLLSKVLEKGLQDFLEHRYSMAKCDTPNLRQLLENQILKDAQESGAVTPSFAAELALEIERVDKLPSVYD